MSPARSAFDEELSRARLAFISAGQPALGAPRRALPDSGQVSRNETVTTSVPLSSPGTDETPRRPTLAGFHLTPRQVVAVLVLLLCGVGVTLTALNRSSASTVPVEPSPIPSAPTPVEPSPSASPPALVRVHVLGAVASPGVVTVTNTGIVQDAVLAAGGLRPDADPAELNLAAPVSDGQQVIVGTTDDPRGEIQQQPGAVSSGHAPGPVNLNTATQAELEELPGVGPVLAGEIMAWRQENGGFTSAADLQEVSGIGPKNFAKLEPLVTT